MSRLAAGQRHAVRFTLNGKACAGEAEPRMLLTDFLRHQIGATGTHVGCEHGVCGACHSGSAMACSISPCPIPSEIMVIDRHRFIPWYLS